jgi:hypothetical protein
LNEKPSLYQDSNCGAVTVGAVVSKIRFTVLESLLPALSVTVNVITLIPSDKEFTEVTSRVSGTLELPDAIGVVPTLIL